MRTALIEKVQRRLSNNFPDYEYDEDLLNDYFDEACDIIRDWKRLSNDSSFFTGNYDRPIIQFIIESLNVAGIEGQSMSSANGITKSFYGSPEANLKSQIPQSL